MNKITPHLLRDLDATLPTGTECYLDMPARSALIKYRGKHSATFFDKNIAVTLLSLRLGRGLKRFLMDDIRKLMPSSNACRPERLA